VKAPIRHTPVSNASAVVSSTTLAGHPQAETSPAGGLQWPSIRLHFPLPRSAAAGVGGLPGTSAPAIRPSGLRRNLNFRSWGSTKGLTPGQKNVLIFGGLALGFAFSMSLLFPSAETREPDCFLPCWCGAGPWASASA